MTTRHPHIGPGLNDYQLTCGHNGPTNTGPLCQRPGTSHHFVDRLGDTTHAIVACDEHAIVARLIGYTNEHPTANSACSMPGAIWVDGPPSRCDLDDSGIEPEIALTREVAAL